jgi:tetratricopeptide (TPR) repeat protein
MNENQYDQARICYENAISKDQDNSILYSNLSEAYLKLNFNAKALKSADKAIELLNDQKESKIPLLEKLYVRKTKALYKLNKFNEVVEILCKISPDLEEKILFIKEMSEKLK